MKKKRIHEMTALEMAKLPPAELRELGRTGAAPLVAYKGSDGLERGWNPEDPDEEERAEGRREAQG